MFFLSKLSWTAASINALVVLALGICWMIGFKPQLSPEIITQYVIVGVGVWFWISTKFIIGAFIRFEAINHHNNWRVLKPITILFHLQLLILTYYHMALGYWPNLGVDKWPFGVYFGMWIALVIGWGINTPRQPSSTGYTKNICL